jgi:hypothetical protein
MGQQISYHRPRYRVTLNQPWLGRRNQTKIASEFSVDVHLHGTSRHPVKPLQISLKERYGIQGRDFFEGVSMKVGSTSSPVQIRCDSEHPRVCVGNRFGGRDEPGFSYVTGRLFRGSFQPCEDRVPLGIGVHTSKRTTRDLLRRKCPQSPIRLRGRSSSATTG